MCKRGNSTIYANCLKQVTKGEPLSNKQLRALLGRDGSCYGKRGKVLKPPKKKRITK